MFEEQRTARVRTAPPAPVEARPTSEPVAEVNPERIFQMAWGYASTFIVDAAVRTRLFDVLEREPLSIDEICRETGASPRGVRILANALVGLRLLERTGERYALTPESSRFLVSSNPQFQGAFFRTATEAIVPHWSRLTEVVRTGRPDAAANRQDHGSEFFPLLVEAIFPLSYPAAQAFGEYLDVARTTTPVSVLDVGAGSGVWGIALAHQSPLVRIHAVDWPKVLEITQRVAARHGVADRLTTAAGDLLEADLGRDHDVATIGLILHSEGVEDSRRLLRRVHDALKPGGTVAVMEFVANNDRTGPPNVLTFGIEMLVHTEQGDVFTFPEMRDWLEEAGFTDVHTLDVPGPSPLIVARKP